MGACSSWATGPCLMLRLGLAMTVPVPVLAVALRPVGRALAGAPAAAADRTAGADAAADAGTTAPVTATNTIAAAASDLVLKRMLPIGSAPSMKGVVAYPAHGY